MNVNKIEILFEDEKVKLDINNECQIKKTHFSFAKNQIILSSCDQVQEIKLYFDVYFKSNTLFKGDAFERTYATNRFVDIKSAKYLPWYFIALIENQYLCYGVKTNPKALCYFGVNEDYQLYLVCNVRNGSHGVKLNGRTLNITSVVTSTYKKNEILFDVECDFCKKMLNKNPLLTKEVIYGFNNWYYAYGESSQQEIINDIDLLASLTKDNKARPYMVIDDCWQKYPCSGPWDQLNKNFTSLKELVDYANKKYIKMGIWMRPLTYHASINFPDHWILHKNLNDDNEHVILDFSIPEVMDYILQQISGVLDNGFTLLKYDFVTRDILGVYGGFSSDLVKDFDWSFSDTSKTNIELIEYLYKSIKEVAKDTLLIGCNALSHVIVGYAEMQRIGDDTSGLEWERTRDYGVNTLTNRLSQNNIFYQIDADCVGIIDDKISWSKNKQWMDLLSYTDSPLFISIKPSSLTSQIKKDIIKAFKINADRNNTIYPIFEGDNRLASCWMINGENKEFYW